MCEHQPASTSRDVGTFFIVFCVFDFDFDTQIYLYHSAAHTQSCKT